ncbi:type I pullulanase [Bacillus dakarensis]|uniref:type I pullulanase n=1 Tax=Robertmurraya dakarensis TaxID=1926278 RepID=UPI0009825F95|nr:type I pullulanase [Bacillus dakarensis]
MIIIERIFQAYLDEMKLITILLPKTYHEGRSAHFQIHDEQKCVTLQIRETIDLDDAVKYICSCESEPMLGKTYWISDEHGGKTDLQIGAVIRSDEFDQKFYYDGDLGVSYDKDKTVFKLWAPTATGVKLKLYSPELKELDPVEMRLADRGVWIVEVEGDLEYFRYSYLVCVNLEWKEAVDPYAVSVTANGQLGVIIDLNKAKIEEKNSLPPLDHPVDAIIYETHIRDFTIHPHSGVKEKGKYLGAAEVNTKNTDGTSTGLSYVKDLGVTHIELLPLHDFEGVDELGEKKEYNWGYNPLHFNAPDGSYSSDPTAPYARIIELKKLIAAIHDQGLRVIVDVVYNHVYKREESSFEKIVPGYYFRHDVHGLPSNGTGVGNDVASERLMVRKFIIDSLKFWKSEYHVDGFRFDLMGILDIETMTQIRNMLDEIDPQTLMIGEGWDLNTPIPVEQKASIRNQAKLPRIGQFNDWFRDSIKGSTFNLHDRGYILENEHYYEAAKQVIAGSIGIEKSEKGLFLEPVQSVNYIESHDNHTLWDKLKVCEANESEDWIKKRHRLATSIVLLSQGIPFLHSGQEFFRSKQGHGNSYRSPDEINQLDWDACRVNWENVQYLRGIIQIRKSHRAFRFNCAELIRRHMQFLSVQRPVIAYLLDDVGRFGTWNKIAVLFNPAKKEFCVDLPEKDWKVLANDLFASVKPIETFSDSQIVLKPCSTNVLVK